MTVEAEANEILRRMFTLPGWQFTSFLNRISQRIPLRSRAAVGHEWAPPVAGGTQGNEIVVRIITGLAPPLQVVNLNSSH